MGGDEIYFDPADWPAAFVDDCAVNAAEAIKTVDRAFIVVKRRIQGELSQRCSPST